jgi:carboxymethylenebutenolidase
MASMNHMISTVTIASDGPRRFGAYLAQPAQTSESEKRPAILVLSDMFGLNDPIRAVADHYASLGHVALVPNLFWRSEIPDAISYDDPQHAKAWARLKALDLDWILRRRAVCIPRRGALRRRCGGVALRSRHLAASR